MSALIFTIVSMPRIITVAVNCSDCDAALLHLDRKTCSEKVSYILWKQKPQKIIMCKEAELCYTLENRTFLYFRKGLSRTLVCLESLNI